MPRFRDEKNVTVFTYTGANTHIDCAVDNLGQDTVISWVRRRDLHILTIATITYTADRRYRSLQHPIYLPKVTISTIPTKIKIIRFFTSTLKWVRRNILE